MKQQRHTRASISISRGSYLRLRAWAKLYGFSCSGLVQGMVTDLVNGCFDDYELGYGDTRSVIERIEEDRRRRAAAKKEDDR